MGKLITVDDIEITFEEQNPNTAKTSDVFGYGNLSDFNKPNDQRATMSAPTIPISGSIHTRPKYLAASRANIAVNEVNASANTCR